MVQEIPSDIPEELYNLTQLAYVSYAAPKLSTDARSRAAHEGDYLRRPASEPKPYGPVKYHTVPYYDASAGMINLSPADYYAPPSYHGSLSHALDGGSRIIIVQDRAPEELAPYRLHSLRSPEHDASTMAEATKKKWTKKWEIIQGPGGPQAELQSPSSAPDADGLFIEAYGRQRAIPTPMREPLSPADARCLDSERSSLILYAPTIRHTDTGSGLVAGDKDVPMFTIIECGGPPEAVSPFAGGSPAASHSDDPSSSRFGGASASDESQDSAVVECYYSHKVFDRKKARKIRTASCTSTRSSVGTVGTTTSLSTDGSSQDRMISEPVGDRGEGVASDELDRSRDATNDSGHVESDPTVGLSSDENGPSAGFDVHVCPECNKRYSTSSNLARHRQTHRSLEDKKARKCPFCSKVYVSMPAYSMHVRTHNQGCECPTCGKCFSRPWLLQGHIRTHTGEKPFQCNVCNKSFADKSNLRAHVQTHSNTKPHACSRCGKSFALKSYLYKHEDSSCLKNERPPKAPKPAPAPGRARRKVPKERPATVTSPPIEHTVAQQGSPSNGTSPMTPASANAAPGPPDSSSRPASFPPNVPFKDVVRAKIREVVEDNCKKTARLLAAAAAAAAATVVTPSQTDGPPQPHVSSVPDNRISVIRIAGSTSSSAGGAFPFAPNGGQFQKVECAPVAGSHPPEYPENYAVIA